MATKRFPDHPKHPERLCWGCERYCSSADMLCGNGAVRTPHPEELFGEDWRNEGLSHSAADDLQVGSVGDGGAVASVLADTALVCRGES